jgi:hypothetical protein
MEELVGIGHKSAITEVAQAVILIRFVSKSIADVPLPMGGGENVVEVAL